MVTENSEELEMSRLVGKTTMWFLNRSDPNLPVQAQKRARSLKFRIRRGIVETKALISFVVTVKLICAFVFAYAKCWFSHEAAQMSYLRRRIVLSNIYGVKTKVDQLCNYCRLLVFLLRWLKYFHSFCRLF